MEECEEVGGDNGAGGGDGGRRRALCCAEPGATELAQSQVICYECVRECVCVWRSDSDGGGGGPRHRRGHTGKQLGGIYKGAI